MEALNLEPIERERAKATIFLLDLNRDLLLAARRNAYEGYVARLSQYVSALASGASETVCESLKHSLLSTPHPTIWEEMKRQSKYIPSLDTLFKSAPVTLTWSR